ncbi:MAG: MotA/TolQ/ExbB proton channel family protein [Sulfurimonas sp.]|jgi:biopolymer transport protein ExbB/TolQ
MQISRGTSLCTANFIVISMIPSLFFLAIVMGYMGIIPLNVPLSSVLIIGFILLTFLMFTKHNANYSICKMRSSYIKMEHALNSKLEANSLVINSERKSVLDIGDFLNHYYADIRNNNFVAVAASIFPMLGILGTFLAISISMPTFSVSDTTALDHDISILLSGVGSAFYASIYGILLSLIWTYFEKSGLSKIDHYFAAIKERFKSNVWSNDELTIYKYSQYELKDNRFLTALRETFNLDFVKTLNEQHLSSFKEIMHESNYNFTQISSHLQYASKELKETLSLMDNNQSAQEAKNQIEKNLLDFTYATKNLEKSTKIFNAHLTTSLDKTFEKIDAEIGDIVIKLADFATHVSLESKEVQDSVKKYHQMIASQIKAQ